MEHIKSPKRGEYCASGLLIYGIDHEGHRFADTEKDWMKLVPQHDFHDEAIKWFSSLAEDEIQKNSSNHESMQRITYLGNYQLIVYSQQFMKLNHDTVSAIVGLCGLSDGC